MNAEPEAEVEPRRLSRRAALRAGIALPAATAVASVGGAARAGELPVVNVADHASAGLIDRAAIRRALLAVPASGAVLHIPPGRHQVTLAAGAPGSPTAPPRVADLPSRVEVSGYGATLEVSGSMPTGSCVFRAEGAEDLTVRGLAVTGPGGGPSGASGFVLFACTRVHLEEITVSRMPAMGVRLGSDAAGEPCRAVTIEASSFVDCAAGSIVLVGTEEVAISSCTLGVRETGPRPPYGVGVVSTPYPNHSIVVGSTHIAGCAVGIDAFTAGNQGVVVLASTLAGNGVGARLRGPGVVVMANSLHRNEGAAISATGSGIKIEANSVNHNGGGIAVSGTDVVVRANLLYNCGAGLVTPSGATVAHNMVEGQEV